MPRQLPRTIGIQRKRGSSYIHKEVIRNLKAIAASEDKTLSYVIAEIVYRFFGLEIKDDHVKVKRRMKRVGHTLKGRNVIPFKRTA
jgi:hypothetical protein